METGKYTTAWKANYKVRHLGTQRSEHPIQAGKGRRGSIGQTSESVGPRAEPLSISRR